MREAELCFGQRRTTGDLFESVQSIVFTRCPGPLHRKQHVAHTPPIPKASQATFFFLDGVCVCPHVVRGSCDL